MADARELAERLMLGDVRALARACRYVDDRLPGYELILRLTHAAARRGWVLGVTGAAGVGKSTLIDALVTHFRAGGERVAVLSVDPSSPVSGGALLGDRIRLQRHFEDEGVFIRSLSTRGATGGLSRSAAQVQRLLRAWGAPVVILESVGVGQDELDIARLSHTTLVVTAPGLGDGIQALKAGILEIADVFAVNKADLPGAERARADLELALELRREVAGAAPPRAVPVLLTSTADGRGVAELCRELEAQRASLDSDAGRARSERREVECAREELRAELCERAARHFAPDLERLAQRVQAGEVDAFSALDELSARLR